MTTELSAEKVRQQSLLEPTVESTALVAADGVWHNRLYKGDNLQVLRSLLNDTSVRGHIRLVYVDPPFGTGQNFTVSAGRRSTISRASNGNTAYDDGVVGNDYLNSLRPRLELIRELLAEDSSIYIHIDYEVGHYIKVLLDQIFGRTNFRSDITRIKCNPKSFERLGYSNTKDMILFYTKGDGFVWNHPRERLMEEDLRRLFPKIEFNGRRYTTTPFMRLVKRRTGQPVNPGRGSNRPLEGTGAIPLQL